MCCGENSIPTAFFNLGGMNMYRKCKRMTVHAIGIDKDGNMEYARNGNATECKDLVGACGCVHAEVRLLERMPHPVKVVVSHSPCVVCAVALIHAGVEEVCYVEPYRILDGANILRNRGIKVECIGEIDPFGDR
jgi:deoxycytidylate deaminase